MSRPDFAAVAHLLPLLRVLRLTAERVTKQFKSVPYPSDLKIERRFLELAKGSVKNQLRTAGGFCRTRSASHTTKVQLQTTDLC
jgi:hypothetical protein